MSGGRPSPEGLTAIPNLWNAGLVEVELPSGLTVRGTLPTIPELVQVGLLPNNLRQAALHFADPAWLTASEGTQDQDIEKRRDDRVALVRLLVARFPQQVRVGAGDWQEDATPVDQRLAAIGTREHPGQMDLLDYDILEDVVLRIRTPEEATAVARAIRGGATPEEAVPAETSDERFREQPGGAATGGDGEALGSVVAFPDVPRSGRPGARVRARRGARNA